MKGITLDKYITRRDEISLNRYLTDISNIPLISPEEEVELADKMKKGDKIAREKLITANLRFAFSVAKRYAPLGKPLSDYVNAANMGLIVAVDKFDHTKGFRLISFAVWWIRQSLLSFIYEESEVIRVPLNKVALKNEYSKEAEKETHRMEAVVSAIDIAYRKGDDIIKMILADSHTVSTETVIVDKGETPLTIGDTLVAEEPKEEKINLSKLITPLLTEKEYDIVAMRFGLNRDYPLSCAEIGESIGMSGEHVRIVLNTAIKKLKRYRKKLLNYLS